MQSHSNLRNMSGVSPPSLRLSQVRLCSKKFREQIVVIFFPSFSLFPLRFRREREIYWRNNDSRGSNSAAYAETDSTRIERTSDDPTVGRIFSLGRDVDGARRRGCNDHNRGARLHRAAHSCMRCIKLHRTGKGEESRAVA